MTLELFHGSEHPRRDVRAEERRAFARELVQSCGAYNPRQGEALEKAGQHRAWLGSQGAEDRTRENGRLVRCAACREYQPRDLFHRSPSRLDGLHSYCRPCRRAYARDYERIKRRIKVVVLSDQAAD